MTLETILEQALKEPKDAIRYSLSKTLSERFPEMGLIETTDHEFNIENYASEGNCVITRSSVPHPQAQFAWHKRPYEQPENSWVEVEWQGITLQVVMLSMIRSHYDETRRFIIGPSREKAIEFFDTVCAWNHEVRGEILVYHGSGWYKSEELFQSISNSSYEDLILAGTMLYQIKSDFERFLVRQELYEKHRIPWKRGVLFLGPPGNGKTQMVKAIAHSLGIPVLYVRSLKSDCCTEHDSIRNVFQRARDNSPCLLILEDIDSLINSGNRSFFLNEMDGFSANTGIITLATANNPEKLDPAILDRPSRFDRKYHFELPAVEERARYIRKLSGSLEESLQISESGVDQLAKETNEFSFAYIKELFLSAMMQWMDESGSRSMEAVLMALVEPLRAQMKSGLDTVQMVDAEDEEFDEGPYAIPRRYRR